MSRFLSLYLWTLGIAFFMLCFPLLILSLAFCSRPFTFQLARRAFSLLIRIMGIDLEVKGLEHIDPGTTYLIMGNHQSLFDVFVLPAAIPLVFTGIEAAYHFSFPVWGWLIRKWGCIPIERSNLERAKKSIEKAGQVLDSGLSIAVLPEGHRTRTGRMAPFKKGPFHLAKNTCASILPFGTSGLYDFQRRGGFNLTPGRVTVTIGPPLSYAEYKSLSIEALRDLMFHRISILAGEHPLPG